MKYVKSIFCLLLIAGASPGFAQPGDEMPPGPPPEEMENGQRGPRMAPPGFQPASPFHRVMQELRRENPEEFARLQDLRMNDPEAFRKESRELLQKTIMAKMKSERPQVHEALINLSGQDRSWFFDRLMGPGFGGPGAPPPGWEKGRKNDEREASRKLIQKYHQSDSPEEKEAIRSELRQHLSDQYDQRLNDRKMQIDEAEQKLEQIKMSLEQGIADKDSFIEDKLTIWLNEKPHGKRGPGNNPMRVD